MVNTALSARQIDFTSLSNEPFSAVTHFRARDENGVSSTHSTRTSNWGSTVLVRRQHLDPDYSGSNMITARYTVGTVVKHNVACFDRWSDLSPNTPIIVVIIFVRATPLAASYGKMWISEPGADADTFLEDVLNSLA